MKLRAKRIAVALFAAFLAGFIGLNVIAYSNARSLLVYETAGARTVAPEHLKGISRIKTLLTGVSVPRPFVALPLHKLTPDSTRLTLETHEGIQLAAWYGNQGADTDLVILFHGYSADKTSLLREANVLIDNGCSVLLVDFRGSGESSESYTTLGAHEARDVVSAFRMAKAELQHEKVILYGFSMGAAAILRAISTDGIQPDAVILAAVYDNMLNTIRNRFNSMKLPSFPAAELLVFWGGQQSGFNGFELAPDTDAAFLNCPALFLHGALDPRATLEDGRRVFTAAPEPKDFCEFDALGHESYVVQQPEKWTRVVMGFIQRLRDDGTR